ncbi:hypothetical protein GGS24DRAFT_30659 [Hypoxylon argillaceum]|nr:hypothetical protein GGS24DRAFT_30659 [Hypoxylon argillaceum]
MQSLQQKLQEVGPSQQICAKGRIKELKKKFKYPFHISSLEDIGKSLKLITDQLLLATQGLGLHSHLVISTNVDALGDAIKSQAGVLARLSADANRSQKTNSSNTTQLANINLNVQPLKPMLQALESVTKDRFSKFENQIHTNHSATTARLDILESRTEANAQTMAEVVELLRCFNSRSLPTDQESTGRRLVRAFISKPSLLRDMHESFGFQQDGEKSPSNPTTNIAPRLSTAPTRMTLENPRLCSCTSRRIVERRTSRWYSFDLFSEIETESKHGLGCFNYVDVRSQRRKTFGITYFGLRQLISAAVSVSLCLSYGAGGTSISPVFRYYSVVDKTQSLPFRLIRVLSYAQCFPLFPDSIKPCTRLWAQNIGADCISWIRMVYNNKIASPWDVSANGQTLIDYFVKLCHTSFFHWPQHLNLFIILSELFHLGVTSTQPLYLIQRPGYTPAYGIGYSNINHTVSLLLRSAPEYQWFAIRY